MKWIKRKQVKQKLARGASSTAPKAPMPSRKINWQAMKRVLVAIAFLVFTSGLYLGAEALLLLPVTRVAVAGEFNHVNKATVVREVGPFLDSGFVMLDLDEIRSKLRQQPWIFEVSLERRWPDEVLITVEEQSVIAHWGKSGLLNHRGDLFRPKEAVSQIEGLPLLQGPDGETVKVMAHFSELNELLEQYHLSLERLSLSDRNTWSAQLKNGAEIVLGGSEVMTKMRRFLSAYEKRLSEDFSRIERIDLRYSNGFAIDWREAKVHKS